MSAGPRAARAALAGALAGALLACSASLDLARARRAVGLTRTPPVPELVETPPAELPAPEGLRATSGELRVVPLKWDPLLGGDVGGYALERASAPEGPFSRIATLPQRMQTSAVDRGPLAAAAAGAGDASGLPDGITVYYRVRAYAPSGRLGAASAPVSATTAPSPAPPEDLRAYSLQPRQVPLSWSGSADADVAGYKVYRGPTSRGPFELVAEIPDRYQTLYVDRPLGDLRVFYYRVSARNRAGAEGASSEPVRAVTKPEPLPPVGLRVAGQRLGANRLAWEPNVETDISEYQLLRLRGRESSPELVAVVPARATSAVDGELGADESVSYSLLAVDRDGLESAPSQPIDVMSEGYALAATVRRDGVHLAWKPRPDEGFARTRVLRAGLAGLQRIGYAEQASFLDPDVESGRRYRYVVVFERPDGSLAPPSAPVDIRIPG